MHYLKVNYFRYMRYKACSNAQKYELKPTRKIKSLFFFAFQANNPKHCTKMINPCTI
ncbi:hypothetical protein BACSTE_03565 [Bacteroides stercoris ATCC 43183]|uniref:Uncharacterized protein n=1 Tax=Bacteroides stercoris ATCC 43183 TaxID=449673 RepID=B0NVN4_BACSE|nr:hypothetical protein BACSTE_03565 [Bacteroides stercoris ATCC 43183]